MGTQAQVAVEPRMKYITWNSRRVKYFRRAYARAVARGAAEFTFMGNSFAVAYARGLLEYLTHALDDARPLAARLASAPLTLSDM